MLDIVQGVVYLDRPAEQFVACLILNMNASADI